MLCCTFRKISKESGDILGIFKKKSQHFVLVKFIEARKPVKIMMPERAKVALTDGILTVRDTFEDYFTANFAEIEWFSEYSDLVKR